MTDRIGEAELMAYVDDQLELKDRLAVETYLAAHPEAAAMVMEQLRLRSQIRLFLAEETHPPSAAAMATARRLERRLGWVPARIGLRQGLAAACLLALGWVAHATLGGDGGDRPAPISVPAFVDEAAEAYATMRLKLAAGDAPYPTIIPLAARHAGGMLPIPELAGGLRLLGSDLVPWDGGAALLILYDGPGEGVVGLFAAEVAGSDPAAPQVAAPDGIMTVYWRDGPFVYALTGLPEPDLLAIARKTLGGGPRPGPAPDRAPESSRG